MTDTLKIEAGKEYLLRNGWRMRCYATDGGGFHPIHGAYFDTATRDWVSHDWTKRGHWSAARTREDGADIISPAPETIEVDCWLWVYADGSRAIGSHPWMPGSAMEKPGAQIHIKRSIPVGEGM
jgi:hypothetical protein